MRSLLVGQRQRVGQHQTALGVGVADLDGDALTAGQHVAGAEGIGGNGVLDRRDQHPEPDLQARRHDHRGEAQHIGRAAHVLLHQQHAAGRLDVEPAGVEAHALAHEGHLRRGLRPPREVDEARRLRGRAPDGVDHREVLLEKRVALDDGYRGLVNARQRPHRLFQVVRPHVVGRRVDQVAGEEDAVGQPLHPVAVRSGRQGEAQCLAGLAAVAGEAVAAQHHGQCR